MTPAISAPSVVLVRAIECGFVCGFVCAHGGYCAKGEPCHVARQSSCRRRADDAGARPLRQGAGRVPLALQHGAETLAEGDTSFPPPHLPAKKASGFAESGFALVPAPGFCHVQHRTVLLSQLMAWFRARPRFAPRGEGIRAKTREGRPPGRGRVDGGRTSNRRAGKRHEGCLRNEWLALDAASAFAPCDCRARKVKRPAPGERCADHTRCCGRVPRGGSAQMRRQQNTAPGDARMRIARG